MSEKNRRPGELEAQVMSILWDSSTPLSGVEVQAGLTASKPALTTVLTVLQRLSEKGMLNRVQTGGRGVKFEPTLSREEHSARALLNILQAESDAQLTLSHFVGALNAEQRETLMRALRTSAAD